MATAPTFIIVVRNICISADVTELQRFVSVILDIAAGGESDLTNDKLSDLYTVGSGYDQLIYDSDKTMGFKALVDRCSSVWNACANNEKLLTILVSICNPTIDVHIVCMCMSPTPT